MTTAPTAPGTAAPEPRWERLHPLSPLLRVGRIVPALVIVLVGTIGQRQQGSGTSLVVYAVVAVLAVAAGAVRWLVTRWAFDGRTLRIETGLVRRDTKQLPVARIQAVDVVQPLLARFLGMAELKIRLAGAGRDSRLAYLPEARATALRAALLAAHHGLDPATPEPLEQPMTVVPVDRIVGSVLLSGPALVLLAALVALGVAAHVSTAAAIAGSATAFAALVALSGAVWRRVNEEYGFTLAAAPDGLRVRRGLLSTVAETIPIQRVQAVRQIEPLWWRPLGWCRLELDLAGMPGRDRAAGGRQVSKTLLPVGSPELAAALRAAVLGPVAVEPGRPPSRARAKSPLSYHFLGAAHDGRVAVGVTGRLRKVSCWVPLAKTQSVRRVQGPVQRRLGLATVHVDAAGRRVAASFRDRDTSESDRLVVELAAASRAARGGPPAAGQPGDARPGDAQLGDATAATSVTRTPNPGTEPS